MYYGSSYAYLASYNTTITVLANTTGGNGTGGNTGCGYESAYASINAYSLTSSYSLGDTFTGTIHTYCAVLNHTMVLDWTVRNTGTNNTVDAGSFNWTAMQLYETHNVTSATLATQPVGNYIFSPIELVQRKPRNVGNTAFHRSPLHRFEFNRRQRNGWKHRMRLQRLVLLHLWMVLPMPAYAGDTVNATVFTDCNLLNQTMVVHYAISNSSTYLTSGNWSWTAMNLNDTHYVEVTNIPAGTYTLTADVYYGSSYAYLASYNTTIIVFANTTGGNGTGGNTGCGYESAYASINAYSLTSSYSLGDTFTGTIHTYCAVLNHTMVLDWTVRNTGTNNTVDAGSFNWTAMQLYETHNVTSATLATQPVGNYIFEAQLSWYNGSQGMWETLHSIGHHFTVSNSTGGNGTGNTSGSNEYMDIDHSGYAYETADGLEVWTSEQTSRSPLRAVTSR